MFFLLKKGCWCRRRESNSRPTPYQGVALPLRYSGNRWFLSRNQGKSAPGAGGYSPRVGQGKEQDGVAIAGPAGTFGRSPAGEPETAQGAREGGSKHRNGRFGRHESQPRDTPE